MKNKQEQDKHRHHKQPQAFLKGFAFTQTYQYQKPSDIFVYKKGEPYKEGVNPSLDSIKETGYGEDFYAFKNEKGDNDFNKYENILMAEFEHPAQPVLEKIKRFEEINYDEKIIFSRYVASMATRSDWWKGVGEQALTKSASEVKENFLSDHKGRISEAFTQDKISEIVEQVAQAIKVGERTQQGMIEYAEKLSEILIQMNWQFLVAPPNMPYLTSDNPVSYYKLNNPDSELIFPISSKITLSLSWREILSAKIWKRRSKRFWEVNDNTVVLVREIICYAAMDEVYFSRKSKWLVDFINKRKR